MARSAIFSRASGRAAVPHPYLWVVSGPSLRVLTWTNIAQAFDEQS
jgi:hypothetical protein